MRNANPYNDRISIITYSSILNEKLTKSEFIIRRVLEFDRNFRLPPTIRRKYHKCVLTFRDIYTNVTAVTVPTIPHTLE